MAKRDLWWYVGAGIAVLVATFGVVSDAHGALVALVMAMPFAAWFIFRRKFNAVYLSPTLIVALFFAIIGVFGYLLRGFLASLNGRGTSISLALTDDQSFQTLILIMGAATITIVAAGLGLYMVREREAPARSVQWKLPEPNGFLIFLAAVVLVAFVASAGFDQLINRLDYQFIGKGTFAGTIGGSAAPAMVVVLGYFFGATRGGKRFATVVLLVGYTMVLFGLGSRRFALVPILFGVGLFLARNSKRTRLVVLLCAALTAALMPLPLMFRGSLLHGVIPYFQMFTELSPADADWAAALNNVLVSFSIVGATAFGGSRVQVSDLWVSLNPLPGDMAGWYAVSPHLGLNSSTPTAGLGELANVDARTHRIVRVPDERVQPQVGVANARVHGRD